jgi:hypothetical protein
MSRAFVREQDVDSIEDVSDRPVSEHPNDVTETGMAQIEAALAEARAAHAIAVASSDRPATAATARDLRYWSARRATAQIVPASTDLSRVRFGTTVSIIRDDGRAYLPDRRGRRGRSRQRIDLARITTGTGDAWKRHRRSRESGK